jgi:hypothetical protein
MKTTKIGVAMLLAMGASLSLAACADDDGYHRRSYTSMSVGVTSGGGYYDHHSWRRDRDGDGVPNRFDAAPHNPYVQ